MLGSVRWNRPGLPLLRFVLLAMVFATVRPALADDPALETWIGVESGRAQQKLFANISPPDCAKGVVIASPSRNDPNYFFHWVRDAALTMGTVVSLSERNPADRAHDHDLLKDYAALSRKNQTFPLQPGSQATTGLGEPKFEVNGDAYAGPWGRPQNDGPALRATTLIRFARQVLDADPAYVATLYDGRLPTTSVIKTDLEYVGHQWPASCFDLWEESQGNHFYTRMTQYRGLRVGAAFARQMHDDGAANFYDEQARRIRAEIETHWDPSRGYIVATQNPTNPNFKPSQLDTAAVLAALHTATPDDPFFGPTDDHVLATAQKLSQAFRDKYKVNQIRANGDERATLQPGIGRYPEDVYDGVGFSGGNPWFLTTAAFAELCYRATSTWNKEGRLTVTPLNIDFLRGAIASQGIDVPINAGDRIAREDARFARLITALIELGDGYLRRIRQHCDQDDGALSEEFNHDTGIMQGAHDLTWSYAAILTAFQARQYAKQQVARPVPVPPAPVPVGAP